MLSGLLSCEDFATRQSDREKSAGKLFPDFDSRIFGGFDRKLRPIIAYGHAPLTLAYRMFGLMVADYTVFSVERNPWDRAVSTFYWSNRNSDMRQRDMAAQFGAFEQYLRQSCSPGFARRRLGINAHRDISQRCLYSINQIPMVDVMLRFEALEQDLERLSRLLNLDQTLSVANISAKRGFRKTETKDFRCHYTPITQELIAAQAAWEIRALGYNFDLGAPPVFQPDPQRHEIKAKFLRDYCR